MTAVKAPPEAKIGAFVLETLTTGMYTNPLDALREYIQNAYDSIQAAERKKVLANGGGRIDLYIDDKRRTLRIRDNGLGISRTEALDKLLSIGMSSKDFKTEAGFRGIGRLAGIAYCKRIVFRTQFSGEDTVSVLAYDCLKLRKVMSPGETSNTELADVLLDCVEIDEERVKNKDHFFEVVMEDIHEEGAIFLDWKPIEDYLCQTVPVGYDTQTFMFAPKIYDWLKRNKIVLPQVNVSIKQPIQRQILKPYSSKDYRTKRDNYTIPIRDVNFYLSSKMLFWIWYAETSAPGMFDDSRVAGFRVRKSNISLGATDIINEIFQQVSPTNERFNYWFMGEVHLLDPALIPNARRDGIEDSAIWREVRNELIAFARDRCKEVHDKSKIRNLDLNKVLRPAKDDLEIATQRLKDGFASKSDRDKIVGKIEKHAERLKAALTQDRNDREKGALKEMLGQLSDTESRLESEAQFTAQNLSSALNRKQRAVIAQILEILHNTLDERNYELARAAILDRFTINEDTRD